MARRELVFIQLIIPLSISLNAIVIMIVPAAAWYLGKAVHYKKDLFNLDGFMIDFFRLMVFAFAMQNMFQLILDYFGGLQRMLVMTQDKDCFTICYSDSSKILISYW